MSKRPAAKETGGISGLRGCKMPCSRGVSGSQDIINGHLSRWNHRLTEERWEDEAPKVSLARKLQGDDRLASRTGSSSRVGWPPCCVLVPAVERLVGKAVDSEGGVGHL